MNNETLENWNTLCEKWDKYGYSSLSRDEKTWMNIRSLIDSINNGGVISYFYNTYADTIVDCLDDVKMLEADDILKQINIVCALFSNGVPNNIEERNEVINSWSEIHDGKVLDELFEQVDENLMPLMDVLEEKLDEFIRQNNLSK